MHNSNGCRLLNGKEASCGIIAEVRVQTNEIFDSFGRRPGLAVVITGDDPASRSYVSRKKKACIEAGIESFEFCLPKGTSQQKLISQVKNLNLNPEIDGILVQLPLPRHITEAEVLKSISPAKDVDCFHPVNVGKMTLGMKGLRPCTPSGIIELLRRYEIETRRSRIVVVGRSNIVGKPVALMLLEKNTGDATVTIAHSMTPDLASVTREADILIVAVGKPGFIDGTMIKKGAVVIDVGTNHITGPDGKGRMVGDVDFDTASGVASAITPVPGGVGPMTIAMLMVNCVKAMEESKGSAISHQTSHFSWKFESRVAIVKLPTHFDLYNADMFKNEILTQIREKEIKGIILDFSEVDFIDSSALAVLTTLKKRDYMGVGFHMAAIGEKILKIFTKTHLVKFFAIYKTIQEAIDAL